MIKQYYAFGSICRGEIDRSSDVDLLACVSEPSPEIDPEKFSIYQHARLEKLWQEGNPFAWHLHLESRLLFASDGEDFLASLGRPARYVSAAADCEKFTRLFRESAEQLAVTSNSSTFNLSCMFLAARNFATCFSLAHEKPVFSRASPLLIASPLKIDREAFDVLARARVLSTRGQGAPLRPSEIALVLKVAPSIAVWMTELLNKVKS